jgi:hypothetical protein
MRAICYAHVTLLDLIKNDNWIRVLIMKFIFMQFLPSSCHFIVRLNIRNTPFLNHLYTCKKTTATQ